MCICCSLKHQKNAMMRRSGGSGAGEGGCGAGYCGFRGDAGDARAGAADCGGIEGLGNLRNPRGSDFLRGCESDDGVWNEDLIRIRPTPCRASLDWAGGTPAPKWALLRAADVTLRAWISWRKASS